MLKGIKDTVKDENRITKIGISLTAVILIIVHTLIPSFIIDQATIILIIIAVIPWLSSLFKSVELAGLKVEFQDIKEQLRNLDNQIEASRLLEGIKKHISDIKEFFQFFRDAIPPVPLAEEILLPERMSSSMSIEMIERHPLFEDIKKCHLPDEFKNLFERWKEYRKLLDEYYNKYNDIIGKIKKEGTDMESEWICAKVIQLLKGETWSYKIGNVSQNLYSLIYTNASGSGYYLVREGTEDDIKKYEEMHKKISEEIKAKYEKEFKILLQIEKKLVQERADITHSLLNIGKYPDFPNTNCCNVIKSFQGRFK